ncbi:MAG: hypothetical protein ISEC1_P1946 [Thiomicrorhabdus sp.]|nr:MAG: hypothetical protein ISEC1_P1946 [Thiomicrorhabdus sp.]
MKDQDKGAKPKAQEVTKDAGLWTLYDQLDDLRVQASETINPMLKARLAEKAVVISSELIRELILKLETLEKQL